MSDLIDVRLTAVRFAAEHINLYEFCRMDGDSLPKASPGAHIDIHLPPGVIRQYSLAIIDPTENCYTIGVKRDPNSRGGSRYIHDELRVGAILKIGRPRNNFPIVDLDGPSIFIAGGIGITPIWSMVRHLYDAGREWELHYACRTRSQAAFADDLGKLGPLRLHVDEEAGGVLAIHEIVERAVPNAHFYFCGPEPMRRAFEDAVANWPPGQIHVELFSNPNKIPVQNSSYVVELARTGRSFVIPAGETILNVLRAEGIDVLSSCEQGVCGTCETAVLSGIPDHRDIVLTHQEKSQNKTMLICCSGSKTDRLVLDL